MEYDRHCLREKRKDRNEEGTLLESWNFSQR